MGLRDLRKNKQMTLKQLSEISGVSMMYISELERRVKENPSAQIAKSLATALGMTIDNFLAKLEEADKPA